MEIRKATKKEYDAVRAFYHSLIDCMEDAKYKPMWEKDIYPAAKFLRESIQHEELHIGLLKKEIAAAMVLDHRCNEEYKKCNWQINAEDSEITMIHVLGVHPRFGGQGLAKQMVSKALDIAGNSGQKAVRLDVLGGNLPAEKLYPAMGFKYMDTVKMYVEDTGWTDFKLYEYVF